MATTTNIAAIDGGGNTITLRADQNPDNSLAMHCVPEIGGAAVSPTNPLPVASAGNIGNDASANAPAGPGTGSTFTFGGSSLTLLATVAANPGRKCLEINNTTGALVVLVIDDGANTAGKVSLLPLAPGAGQFQQGGSWVTTQEQGRVRAFGTASTFLYAREN